MKSKIKSGSVNYFLIFIGLILGVAIVCLGLMVLSPGVEIFGYKFFINNKNITIEKYTDEQYLDAYYDNGDIKNIVIVPGTRIEDEIENTAKYFNVEVLRTSDVSLLQLKFEDNSYGFMKDGKNKNNVMNYNIATDTNTLTITLEETNASWMLSKQITVKVLVPAHADYNSSNFNFDIKTNKGYVSIGNGTNVLNTGNMKVESVDGSISINDKNISAGNIDLKSLSGDIKMGNQTTNAARTIKLETDSSNISCGDLTATGTIIKSNKATVKIGNVKGALQYDSAYGLIMAGNVTGNFTVGETTSVSSIFANDITGDFLVAKADASNIEVNSIGGRALVNTKSGYIKIGKITGTTIVADGHVLNSEKGSITFVSETVSPVNVTSTSGKITATFKNISSTSSLTTTKGEINLNLLHDLEYALKFTTQGKIHLKWENDITHTAEYSFKTDAASAVDIETRKVICTSESGNINVQEVA